MGLSRLTLCGLSVQCGTSLRHASPLAINTVLTVLPAWTQSPTEIPSAAPTIDHCHGWCGGSQFGGKWIALWVFIPVILIGCGVAAYFTLQASQAADEAAAAQNAGNEVPEKPDNEMPEKPNNEPTAPHNTPDGTMVPASQTPEGGV